MNHEKLFKREDGSKANIRIDFWNQSFSNECNYRVAVSICEPKKRTFRYVNDADNYEWRRLNTEERKNYEMTKNLEYVTIQEIQETAIELWNQMKPTFV